jgi:hypothetical protein
MLIRYIAGIVFAVTPFPLAITAYAKCPASRVEIHGSITGKLPPDAKLAVSLVFRNGRKHPTDEMVSLEGSTFSATLGFSKQSGAGYFNGLLGEWGEKCDRILKQVVVRLVDQEGREIDKVTLNVQGDFLITASGIILRSPIILHATDTEALPREARNPFAYALTSFSILSNIRPVSWGVPFNGKDLAMFRRNFFPTRRARYAPRRRALPLQFALR